MCRAFRRVPALTEVIARQESQPTQCGKPSLLSAGFRWVGFSGFPLLLRSVLGMTTGSQWPPGVRGSCPLHRDLRRTQWPPMIPMDLPACLPGGRWGQGHAFESPYSQTPTHALSILGELVGLDRSHGLDGGRWRPMLFVWDSLRPRWSFFVFLLPCKLEAFRICMTCP